MPEVQREHCARKEVFMVPAAQVRQGTPEESSEAALLVS